METETAIENNYLEIPFSVIEYIFNLVSFIATEIISTIKEILQSLFNLLSIVNISGPEDVVLWLLSISSVVFILSKLGWLPGRIDRAINRNQRSEIKVALELLGVKEQEVRSKFRSMKFKTTHDEASVKKNADDLVKAHTASMQILVGRTHPAPQSSFVDLMGASTKANLAVRMATLIKTVLGSKLMEPQLKNLTDFDYVATPKSGSPLIGYEFSKLTEKPLLLHSMEPKYKNTDGSPNYLANFDLSFTPERGKSVLIVDDSSTGGRKIMKLIVDLRALDLRVDHCVVIFEPQSKVKIGQNARSRLAELDVNLISIVESS
jgi:orotate phosphoribosyltransferase